MADLAAAAGRALALGGPRLAERLARRAWDDGSFAAGLALARSLIDQRQAQEADRVMIAMAPNSESEVAQLGLTRACNLAYGMGQLDKSMALLRQTEGAVPDLNSRDDVAATYSKLDVHNRQQLAPVLGPGEGPSLPVTLVRG